MVRRYVTLLFACTAMAGCAKTPQLAETDPPSEEVQAQADSDLPPQEIGKLVEKEPALDRTQETVYNVVNGAAQ